MTQNKDLKRLVRARMQRTGESYTTARARLLVKREASAESDPSEYADLAGISDDAVRDKTGRDWAEWVAELDAIEAESMPHRDIAKHLGSEVGLPGWWAQMVTVGYERIKGLREIGQRRDGTYEVNKSKTLPVPVERLYRAVRDTRLRRRWLSGAELAVRKTTPGKSMRATWDDDTPVEISFVAKGEHKSQLALQHRKLASKRRVEAMKAFWSERLEALAELLDS